MILIAVEPDNDQLIAIHLSLLQNPAFVGIGGVTFG